MLPEFIGIKSNLIVHEYYEFISQSLSDFFWTLTVRAVMTLYELYVEKSSLLRVKVSINYKVFLIWTKESFVILFDILDIIL